MRAQLSGDGVDQHGGGVRDRRPGDAGDEGGCLEALRADLDGRGVGGQSLIGPMKMLLLDEQIDKDDNQRGGTQRRKPQNKMPGARPGILPERRKLSADSLPPNYHVGAAGSVVHANASDTGRRCRSVV